MDRPSPVPFPVVLAWLPVTKGWKRVAARSGEIPTPSSAMIQADRLFRLGQNHIEGGPPGVVLHGVPQEVFQQPAHQLGVKPQGHWWVRQVRLEAEPLLRQVQILLREEGPDEGPEVGRLPLHGVVWVFHLSEEEEVAHQVGGQAGFGEDGLAVLPHLLRRDLPLLQSLGVPLDHREGGAQVVGDVGNEGLLLLVHPLFLPPGLVQLIQQTAEADHRLVKLGRDVLLRKFSAALPCP